MMGQHDDSDGTDLERLQLALVRTQQAAANSGDRIVLVLEWRDGAGTHLPAAGEFVIFNPDFERMLVESGIKLVKVWLDISKDEQRQRLDVRREDPLKALKVSDMDAVAQAKWSDYSAARDVMLTRTHTPLAPWYCVRADHKKPARRAIIEHILQQVAPPEIVHDAPRPDPQILFPFEVAALHDGRLTP